MQMFLHSPAMSEGAAGLTPRIDLWARFCSYLLPERVLLDARNFKTLRRKISMNDGMGNGVFSFTNATISVIIGQFDCPIVRLIA